MDDKALETRLLNAVTAERSSAIGFDDDELNQERQTALEYYKGQMRDVPAMPNRSKVCASEIADTVETIQPDLIEIFTGGEDVVAFQPNSEEDTEQAQQETDFVADVFFKDNRGYSILEDAFLSALLVKTGIFHWYWDEQEVTEEKRYDALDATSLQMLVQDGWEVAEYEESQGPEGPILVNVLATKTETKGRAVVEAFPPEDFAVGQDTDHLPDATYCVARSHVRAQDLIERGYDKDKVAKLNEYQQDEDIDQARDTVDESGSGENDTDSALRIVEVYTHYLRLEGKLYRLVTGNDEKVLLDKTVVNGINFSSITPFRIPGRFTGLSMADKAMEPQRISTGLMRGMLDGIYFAHNQRQEVAEEFMTANTIPDLLRNEPGSPVRSKGGALKPIGNAGPGFDYNSALEHTAIMNERRTGVQRGNQGMNPDTLHDTASGAKIMLTEGQKRTRRIARSFAETGVKEMFKGLHALLRENSDGEVMRKLRGSWVTTNPADWPKREDMTIEIGVGSGGRDQEIAIMREIIGLQTQAVQLQGGANGPLVTMENIFSAVKRLSERAGIKAPESYFSDPAKSPPQQPEQEQPDPDMVKVQMDAQYKQQELELKNKEIMLKDEREREAKAMEFQLARENMMLELELSREKMAADQATADRQNSLADVKANRPGGSLAA